MVICFAALAVLRRKSMNRLLRRQTAVRPPENGPRQFLLAPLLDSNESNDG